MTTAEPKVKRKNIAIVGGGFLGLTLAYYLVKAGHEVTVLEKSGEFGGLASGFKFRGGTLERYYHHFFRSDKFIQKLMEELGIGDKLQWLRSTSGIFTKGKLYPFSNSIELLKFPPLRFLSRLRLGVVSFVLQKTKNYKKFENISAYEWCLKNFGKKVTPVIWEPLLKAKFGDDFDKISMSWLWARIFDRSSSRPNPLSNEYLGYPEGGFQIIVDALVNKCKQLGVNLIGQAELQNYQKVDAAHKLVWEKNGQKIAGQFEVVVGAVPAPIFAKIFKPAAEYKQQLESIKYIGAVCMIISLKKQFSQYYWTSISEPEYPFLAVVEHTNFVDKSLFGGSHILYVAKYLPMDHQQFKMTETELKDLYFKYLKKLNPNFEEAWVEEAVVFKAGFAQHVVDVGYQTPAYETGIDGLYFAHFCQIYPHDRGTNYAVGQAQELFKLINE